MAISANFFRRSEIIAIILVIGSITLPYQLTGRCRARDRGDIERDREESQRGETGGDMEGKIHRGRDREKE